MAKAPSTIRRELNLIDKYRHDARLSGDDQQFLYGAATALAWALGQDVAAPHVVAPQPTEEA